MNSHVWRSWTPRTAGTRPAPERSERICTWRQWHHLQACWVLPAVPACTGEFLSPGSAGTETRDRHTHAEPPPARSPTMQHSDLEFRTWRRQTRVRGRGSEPPPASAEPAVGHGPSREPSDWPRSVTVEKYSAGQENLLSDAHRVCGFLTPLVLKNIPVLSRFFCSFFYFIFIRSCSWKQKAGRGTLY